MNDRTRAPVFELRQLCEKIFVGLAMAVTPYVRERGVKLIRSQNIRPNRFDAVPLLYLDEGFAKSQKPKWLMRGDVIAVRTGANIGDACVVPEDFEGALTFTTLIARPRADKLDSRYLAQYINSPLGQKEVQRLMAGGGKGNLNSGELEKLRIAAPVLKEQTEIADVLEAWDAAIEKAEQLIAAKQKRNARELCRLIESRECTQRASFADILIESREPAAQVDNQKLLSVRLYCNGVERREPRNQNGEEAGTQYFVRRSGQLIYGKQNIFRGAIGLVSKDFDGYLSSQDLPAFDVNEKFDPRWIYYYLSRPTFYRRLEALSAGSGSKRLHPEELYKLHVQFPQREIQAKTADAIELMLHEIELERQRLELLKTQKCGLMQKLLTGRWLVNVPKEVCA